MKKTIGLLLICLLSLSAFAQKKESIDSLIKAKLVKAIPSSIDCGDIAWAVVQKFEIISTALHGYNKKNVLITQPCPELLGRDFFRKGKIYEITIAVNNSSPFGYIINNPYKKENWPIYWAKKITQSK